MDAGYSLTDGNSDGRYFHVLLKWYLLANEVSSVYLFNSRSILLCISRVWFQVGVTSIIENSDRLLQAVTRSMTTTQVSALHVPFYLTSCMTLQVPQDTWSWQIIHLYQHRLGSQCPQGVDFSATSVYECSISLKAQGMWGGEDVLHILNNILCTMLLTCEFLANIYWMNMFHFKH